MNAPLQTGKDVTYCMAEMLSLAVARSDSRAITGGMIDGESSECKGHMDCRGPLGCVFDVAYAELIAKKIQKSPEAAG